MNPELSKEKIGNALIAELVELSIRGLEEMFDADELLFCNRLVKIGSKLVKEGTSLRYSIITLLGLYRLRDNGIQAPFPLEASLESIVKQVAHSGNIGDLGLLFWLCSLSQPDRIRSLRSSMDITSMLERNREAVEGKTTEISWLLAGLSNAALAVSSERGMLEAAAAGAHRILLRNCGSRGIFGHQGKKKLSGILRGRIGTFSDQIYPIYALCRYARAFSNEGAARSALDCGKMICELQGPLGQWWWYYDSQHASVAGRYPVYSVHQDGMAPMALFELQETTGTDFSHHIDRGLLWITGRNELGMSMLSTENHVIWRCIHKGAYRREMDLIAASMGVPLSRDNRKLAILLECRPYHLGWLLYAYADQCSL